MLAGAVGDVEERFSSKNQLQDKDLSLTHDIFDNRPVTMFFKYLLLSMTCECQYVYYHEIYHLNINILHFEY